MKKFLIILTVVSVVCCSVFSVGAVDGNRNDFINFNDYANYTFTEDESTVNVEVSFPDYWNISFVDQKNPEFHEHWYYGNEFTITDTVMPWLKINMHPLGGYSGWDTQVNDVLTDCRFIDLRYFPTNTIFTYNFNLSTSQYDLNLGDQVFMRYFFFVDIAGKVVDIGIHYFEPIRNGKGSYTWTESIKVGTFSKQAVGFVPMFVARNLDYALTDVTVNLSSFEFSFPMSAVQYSVNQNQQMQSTLKSIESAMEKQNQVFDEIVNGEVDPEKPVDSEKFDDLKDNEDKLMGDIQNYLDDGIGFFDNAVGAVFNFANGFQAIKVLMMPVFNLPMFGDIILVSVSLGLIGTLLGVVTMVTSSINKKSSSKGSGKSKGSTKGGKGK